MPYAMYAVDGIRVNYEDDGGDGAPVGLYGGFFDSVSLVRELPVAAAPSKRAAQDCCGTSVSVTS